MIAFSDEALPKDITLAVKGEFIPSRQAVYIPFCIAGLFADAIKQDQPMRMKSMINSTNSLNINFQMLMMCFAVRTLMRIQTIIY